jgi:hypothetical protein
MRGLPFQRGTFGPPEICTRNFCFGNVGPGGLKVARVPLLKDVYLHLYSEKPHGDALTAAPFRAIRARTLWSRFAVFLLESLIRSFGSLGLLSGCGGTHCCRDSATTFILRRFYPVVVVSPLSTPLPLSARLLHRHSSTSPSLMR